MFLDDVYFVFWVFIVEVVVIVEQQVCVYFQDIGQCCVYFVDFGFVYVLIFYQYYGFKVIFLFCFEVVFFVFGQYFGVLVGDVFGFGEGVWFVICIKVVEVVDGC